MVSDLKLTASCQLLDPDLPIFEEFLLPDGNDLLQPVDRIVTGIKGRPTVGGRHYDGHRGFSDLHPTQAMNDGDRIDLPDLTDRLADSAELLKRHALVCFVNQVTRRLALGIVPNHAFEHTDSAIVTRQQLARDLLRVNRLARYLVELVRPSDRQVFRLHRARKSAGIQELLR